MYLLKKKLLEVLNRSLDSLIKMKCFFLRNLFFYLITQVSGPVYTHHN